MKKSLALLILLSMTLQSEVRASTTKHSWRPSLILGYGITNAQQTQTIHLDDTPAPGLDNRYFGSSTLYGAALLGVAIEKELETSFKKIISATGLEVDLLKNNSVKGTVEPMINVSPNFDVLRYSYDIHSLMLQATAKLTKENILHKLGGYIQGGLGASLNYLSNYQEYAPGDSTAAPMLAPFGNENTVSPALSAGIGVSYKIGPQDTRVSFGYRYIYAGRGKLMRSSAQQTNATFTLSPISYQLLTLSLTM